MMIRRLRWALTLSVAEFINPWLEDKVNSGIGLSYRPTIPAHGAWRAVTTVDNPMPELTLSEDLWIRLLIKTCTLTTEEEYSRIFLSTFSSYVFMYVCNVKLKMVLFIFWWIKGSKFISRFLSPRDYVLTWPSLRVYIWQTKYI